jgi:hypothetical protein
MIIFTKLDLLEAIYKKQNIIQIHSEMKEFFNRVLKEHRYKYKYKKNNILIYQKIPT